jgi:hypothetical protein
MIAIAKLDALRPGDDLDEIGNREAPFFLGHFPFRFDHLRVDEDVQLFAPFADGKVDDHQPLRHADLVRGKPDAGRCVHRVDHVVDQRLQTRVDITHRLRGQAKDLGAIFHDRKNRHPQPFFFRLSIIASTVWFARFL